MRAAREGAKGATMVAGEYVEGVIAGKSFAIREWQIKREKREFAQLVEVLRVAQWKRANPALVAEYQRRSNARPEARIRTRLRHQAWRRARYCKNPAQFVCECCSATWCKVPWVRGLTPRFCGDACRQRWRYAHDPAYRERALANSRKQDARRS